MKSITKEADTKLCPMCGPKPKTEFYGNKSAPDGLQDVCKVCNTLRVREQSTKRMLKKKTYPELLAYLADLSSKERLVLAEINLRESECSSEGCTCSDTYEVGSGVRCPIHEK